MPDRYVLDSYAIIGYLEDERFADRIENVLASAKNGEAVVYLHAIHLGEVYYITLREQGQSSADLAYARIKSFPLVFIDSIDEKLLLTAAGLKARYPISYADAFAAAIARIHQAILLTGDPEFATLEQAGIMRIGWLDRKT